MAGELFDAYGRPVVIAASPGVTDLFDASGRPYKVIDNLVAVTNFEDVLQDLLEADADGVVTNEDLSAALPIEMTLAGQPDVPRNITWAFDAHANITAFSFTIVGVNGQGTAITDTFTHADGWSGATAQAYATVTSVTMTVRTGTGATDTMDLGFGDIVGLSNPISLATSVYKIKKNAAHMDAAGYTVDETNGTVDLSTGGAITANDDFTIWYTS